MKIFTTRCLVQDLSGVDLPPDLDSPNTLALIFGGVDARRAEQTYQELRERLPTSIVMGCSTAGEICGSHVGDNSITFAVLKFERTFIQQSLKCAATADDSNLVGIDVAKELNEWDLAAVIVLSDGVSVNGSELVSGLNSVLDFSAVITGGLAGGDARSNANWILSDTGVRAGYVVALGLYGPDIRIGHGSDGGWDWLGPQRVITKFSGAELFELDGTSVLPLYKEYLGAFAERLPASAIHFPFGFRRRDGHGKFVTRSVIGVDEDHQSLLFAGDIPTDSFAQLMSGNLNRLIDGAAHSARKAATSTEPAGDRLGIAISGAGRRAVLADRVGEELEAALEQLGSATALVGFYAHGEISCDEDGAAEFHNQTMTLTTLAER